MNLHQLKQFKKIVIQCHDNPDADSLACAYVLSTYFKLSQIETEIVYSGFAPVYKPNLKLMLDELEIEARFIPQNDDSIDYKRESDTLLLVVDGQYGGGNVKKLPAATVGMIDHHIAEMPQIMFSDIRPFLGSCSTLVWLLLKDCGFDFDKNIKISTALYYGLYSDTGALTEIVHPLDRDMRDSIKYDKALVKELMNSNLTREDITLTGKSLIGGRIDLATKSAVYYTDPCDPNILGFISDLVLQVDTIDSGVVFCEVSGGIKLSVRSCVREIMASELAAYLCEGGGSGGGHADKAGGFISADFISRNSLTPLDFILSRYSEYFRNYDLIYSGVYKPDVSTFEQYIKLKIPIGYVRTTDIFPEGVEMIVRMLEGDANFISDRNTYLMVGIREEVYPITREKFESSYEVLSGEYAPRAELLTEAHYAPTVKNAREGLAENIERHIRPCVSRGEARIYAKQLAKSAKVFTAWNKEGYLYGKPGDWLAVRSDDLNDVYIIRDTIFRLTYRKI
jgi:phosphoglycolate phosphatase